jgi:hypothetical protein
VSLTPGPQPAVVVIRVSKYSFSSQEKPRDLSPRGFSYSSSQPFCRKRPKDSYSY